MTAPIRKFRAGSIACALWSNESIVHGRTVAMLNATVERRYKDRSGGWKSSGGFGRNDIPLVIYCLQKAFEAMFEEEISPAELEEEVAM